RDQLESMLALQMAAVHDATMETAARLKRVKTEVRTAQARDSCLGYGFSEDDPRMPQCVMLVAQQDEANEQRRRQDVARAFEGGTASISEGSYTSAAATPTAPASITTTCTRVPSTGRLLRYRPVLLTGLMNWKPRRSYHGWGAAVLGAAAT